MEATERLHRAEGGPSQVLEAIRERQLSSSSSDMVLERPLPINPREARADENRVSGRIQEIQREM